MGMSSSQARLLSLTARMHDIEKKAQKVQAEKIRLANKSDAVYNNYINKLDETRAVARVMGSDGTMENTLLTGNKILNYNALMSQYAMKSPDGKTYVSAALHNNYNSTDNLIDFLKAYGLASDGEVAVQHEPPYETNGEYTAKYREWQTAHDYWEWQKSLHDDAVANYEARVNDPYYEHLLAEYHISDQRYQSYLVDHQSWEDAYAQWEIDKSAYDQYWVNYHQAANDRVQWHEDKAVYDAEYSQRVADWQVSYNDWIAAHPLYLVYVTDHDNYVQNSGAWEAYNEWAAWDQYTSTDYAAANPGFSYQDWLDYQSVMDAQAAWDQQDYAYNHGTEAQQDYQDYLNSLHDWEARNPEIRKDDTTQPWWDTQYTAPTDLGSTFETASAQCFKNVQRGDFDCYVHILAHLLDFSDGKGYDESAYNTKNYGAGSAYYLAAGWYPHGYTTSTGQSVSVNPQDVDGYAHVYVTSWNDMSKSIDDETMYKAAGAGDVCDINSSSPEGAKLLSKFKPDGTSKSTKQWAIDLLYLAKQDESSLSSLGISGADLINSLSDFQSSMSSQLSSNKTFNTQKYNQAIIDWQKEKPREVINPGTVTGPPEGERPEWTGDIPPAPTMGPVRPVPMPTVPCPTTEPVYTDYVPDGTHPPLEPVYNFRPIPGYPTVVQDPGEAPVEPPEIERPLNPTIAEVEPFDLPEPNLETYLSGIEPVIYYDDDVAGYTTFEDPVKARWYINLWYKMEGLDEVPVIMENKVKDLETGEEKVIYYVENKSKQGSGEYVSNEQFGTPENENYIVLPEAYLDSSDWMTNAVSEGQLVLQVYDKYQSRFIETSMSQDSHLTMLQNKEEIKKLEAQYEADMRKIDAKDRKYDLELTNLDTEREAIKAEMNTLETVIRDNISLNFKLFG